MASPVQLALLTEPEQDVPTFPTRAIGKIIRAAAELLIQVAESDAIEEADDEDD